MAIEKFRFVSPGVQFNEIDDSVIPPTPPAIGPVVIGRTAKGPAMQPVVVSSVGELEKVFGSVSNGLVGATDVWRTEIPTAPTLATYAARAFLRNSNPVTVIRIAGVDLPSNADNTNLAKPGWLADNAYGLFAVSGSSAKLAAIVYAKSSAVLELSASTGFVTTGSASLAGNAFNVRITGASPAITSTSLSFVSTDTNFIRNVLNTNPTRYDSVGYFLGETFEKSLGTFSTVCLSPLSSSFSTQQSNPQSAATGYVTADHAAGVEPIELFRFVGLNNGSNISKEIKISIENVRPSKNTNVTKYGTFDVVIRKLFEPANSQAVLERFVGLTLDPKSENYIIKRIGDSYRKWNVELQRYVEEGSYPNRSVYVRVEMKDADVPETALPHGFKILGRPTVSTTYLTNEGLTGSHPNIPLLTTEISASSSKTTRFGLVSHQTDNFDLVDIVRFKSPTSLDSNTLFSTRFINTGSVNASSSVYVQGTYNTSDFLTNGRILGFDLPIYGGFDGANILEAEPFISNDANIIGTSEIAGAGYRAIKAAIDIVASPELLDLNLLCIPGLQTPSLTSYMIDVCKARGDAMAIIDLVGDYKYAHENGGTEFKSLSVSSVISSLESRALDNSYGAAYFPAVFVQSEGIFMPASIAALGAFGGTEGRSALWFAPAGFNRGGLTEGNAGIGVSRTVINLNSTDRDELYTANINPIATFPNEGVVIFGQKTLQTTPSALDRVNVRRLVNFIKKQISRAATRILFEPNVEQTWNNFKGVVNPFLLSIKNAYGLDDAKVVLDSTTTTADLVDRNILYAKVYIKPTRAIEYIAIDFVVTNSGAAFTE